MTQRKLTSRDMLFTDALRLCPADVVRVERTQDGYPLGHDTLVVQKDLTLLLVKTYTSLRPLTKWESLFHFLANNGTFYRAITLNDRGYDPNYPLPFPELRPYHKLNLATQPTMHINYE